MHNNITAKPLSLSSLCISRSGCLAGGIELCVFLCCSILTCGRKLLGLWPSTPGSGNTWSSTPNFSQPDSVILQVRMLYMKTLPHTPVSSRFSIFSATNLSIYFTRLILFVDYFCSCTMPNHFPFFTHLLIYFFFLKKSTSVK